MGIIDDPFSASMLSRRSAAFVRALQWPGLRRFARSPSMAYLAARTVFFDSLVVEEIERGVMQIVDVGAGYDARAWRFALPGVRFYEVRPTSSRTTTGPRWREQPSTEDPVAVAIVVRARGGADANASVAELAAIRQDWDAGCRPPPKPHVHRTPVRFADGTTIMGVRFLGDDPYVREDAPGFGLYLGASRRHVPLVI